MAALRSLLRRIPGPALLPPSGPSMVHVHGGISPATVARFMGTKSQGGPRTAAAERRQINPDNLLEEINQRIKSINKNRDAFDERARLYLAKQARAVDNTRKIGNVATAVAAAVPVLLTADAAIKHSKKKL